MLHLLTQGGWVVIPLAVCSILATIIVLERIFFYLRYKALDEQEMNLLRIYLHQGKLEDARKMAVESQSALGQVIESGLRQRETDLQLVELVMQSAGELQTKRLQRGLSLLDTIVTASPLLGLLGTVTGIIKAFSAIAIGGASQTTQLSAGIAEALYNTAFGLAIAIPALFFVNIFYGIAEKKAGDLSAKAQEILTILQKG